MFYEDYKVKSGDTMIAIAKAYGYKAEDWKKIWDDKKNAALVAKCKKPENLKVGDIVMIPIPWTVTSKTLKNMGDGAAFVADRDGELGTQLTWVQTVFQGNQPIGTTTPFCVDACPADDNLPFYWTEKEIKADKNLRKHFSDHSSRPPPSAAAGTTMWRGVLALAVVTEKRVTMWNIMVWGWDMKPDGTVTTIGPRVANFFETKAHLLMLAMGLGTGPLTFGKQGWTFREATMEP